MGDKSDTERNRSVEVLHTNGRYNLQSASLHNSQLQREAVLHLYTADLTRFTSAELTPSLRRATKSYCCISEMKRSPPVHLRWM